MRALAGLGNQGDAYAGHRHNVGWMLLDVLERRHAIVDKKDLDLVRLTHIRLQGRGKNGEVSELWLMRPKTYMNENGLGVAKGCKELNLRPEQILVAFDDVDLPLGKLRLRESGGSSGQKGMQSIIDALGTQKIPGFGWEFPVRKHRLTQLPMCSVPSRRMKKTRQRRWSKKLPTPWRWSFDQDSSRR